MPVDRFGIPFFYPSKAGGYFYQMSDNPKNDSNVDWPSEMTFSGPIATMHPNGPTDFGIGKNIAGFSDSIGGCNMDFTATAKRGYAYKIDDARDVEIKCLIKVNSVNSGFSISACTGHHTGSTCCQGFAYMCTTEVGDNPSSFRFRKEMWHVNYDDSPEGPQTSSKMNFKVSGHGWFGIGFLRYNDPDAADSVILEYWINPTPDTDSANWTMLKRIKDSPGNGWGDGGDKCNGDRDQVGTWSNVQNRFKTNSTSGSIDFKAVTLREIDTTASFDTQPPDPGGGGGGVVGSPLSYTFAFKFGSNGTGNGQFQDPHDISFTSTGDLHVTDRVRNDIQKFTATGTYISKFGSSGSADGQLNVPYSCQIDASGNIYVADRENNRIQKFSSSGTFISKITTVNGQAFNKPEDVTFDRTNGDIYILDTGNNRCVKLNSSHTFILQWGSTGSGNGQFEHPHSINTDSNRDVFISCGNQPYIQKFTNTGTFIKKWGSEGDGPGQVRMFLEHMDIDLHDRVHLVNNDVRPIVNVWDNQGVWITQYGKTTSGTADGQFNEPEHITCDSTGKPYVVDAKNQRIQVFNVNEPFTSPPPTPPPSTTPPPPTSTTRVQGSFSLLWDINTYRGQGACSGTGGGGGGGGGNLLVIYTKNPDNDKELSNTSTYTFRTRLAQKVVTSDSVLKGVIVKQLDVPLKKIGAPTATQSVNAKIWNSSNSLKYTSPTILDPATLTTSFVVKTFDFATNTYALQVGDRIGVEYIHNDNQNFVVGGYEANTTTKSYMSQYESNAWDDKTTRALACTIWA